MGISVDLVVTSDDPLSGTAARDGVTPTAGATRILAVAQSTASQNGPWLAQTGAWTRPSDYSVDADFVVGQTLFVQSGTLGEYTNWQLQTGSTVAGAKTYAKLTCCSPPAPALVATSNIALTGVVTVDGVASNTLAVGQYVLPVAQTNPVDNGPWLPNASGAWSRPSFYNSDATVEAKLGQAGQAVLGGLTGVGSVWFQSVGTTLAGAKIWQKLNTSSLLQDALGATLPAQDKTQHKGAAILRDPANGRNTVDHDRADIREFGGNPNGAEQTTALCTGGANVTLGAAGNKQNGQWLFLHQHGPAHGLATPGAPIVVAQGVTGSTSVSVKVVAVTSTHGYTAASAATTIADANAAISILDGGTRQYTTFVEIWPNATPTPGAYKYLFYVQVGGSGPYNYGGACIAWPMFDAEGNVYPMSMRLITSAAATPPEGIPTTAPSSAVANGLRTQIVSGGGTTSIAVSPAPLSIPGAATVCTLCNKIPLEQAAAANAGYSAELRIPFGQFYMTGDVELRYGARLEGCNGSNQQLGSRLLFRDGCGFGAYAYPHGNQWQPGTLYRVGDRVVASLRTGVLGSWTVTAISGGATWGASGTGGDPSWHYTPGNTTVDNVLTWTFQSGVAISTPSGWRAYHVAFHGAGQTIPCGREFAANDLRLDCARGRGNAQPWTANSAAFTAGLYCVPTASHATGKAYRSSGGTTHATTEPTWPRTHGATVVDGTVTWTCVDMYQRQGAGVITYLPFVLDGCQIKGFYGTGLFLEGNIYSTGGNTDVASCYTCDFSSNFGHTIVVQGSDGNGAHFEHCTAQPARAGDGACVLQDNSFYGASAKFFVGNGNQRFQNQPWASAQSMGVLHGCYTEGGAPGDTDWNYPAIWVGGNMRRRPGSKPKIYNGGDSVSVPYDSPLQEVDLDNYVRPAAEWAASTAFAAGTIIAPTVPNDNGMIYISGGGTSGGTEPVWPTTQGNTEVDGSITWTCNGQLVSQRTMVAGRERRIYGNGMAAKGTALLEFSGGFSIDGRTSLKVGNAELTVEQTDHYGMLGPRKIFNTGLLLGGLTKVNSMAAIPTLGAFVPGDLLIWSGNGVNAPRLAIVCEDYGVLGATARANNTAYTQGQIVTAAGQAFVCVVAGTSGASQPASMPGAAFSFHQDGRTLKWQRWFGADPHLRSIPNLDQEPATLTDADQTMQITQGCVRKCEAFTANRAITLGTTNMMPGDAWRIEQHNSVAFTATFSTVDGGSVVMPASTKCWLEIKMVRAGTFSQLRSGTYL